MTEMLSVPAEQPLPATYQTEQPEALPPADTASTAAFEAALAELLPADSATAAAGTSNETTTASTTAESHRKGLRQRFGRSALIRAGLEVAGMGVDAALLGAGDAGFVALQSAFAREAVATAPEIGILNKLSPVHEHRKSPGKVKKIGEVALGVAVAGVAQKFGISIAEHADIATGVGGFALPLATKLGAISGVTAARRGFAARRAA